jgi:NADPH-dependent ferric siderophore reductase
MTQLSQTAERTVRRVRHDTKLRLLEVKSVGRITPKMLRITVGGEELAGFARMTIT